MKDTDRALRRFHRNRMKKKAEKVLKKWYNDSVNVTEKLVGQYADNLTTCSCIMCGNPRKIWREKTLQERKCIMINE